ncbi:MAG: SnoaL-like domain protein [Hydrocarboniphaga sp.]|uniref:nuclear transport factor 2 family protein n=1 Tax=Hydrocarboniphaga sp. TaxID=2033016 RepID=UPI002638A0F6|nr:nuclear transport factor 2 family protein [Hydrocarboniphaga sp.]MDB5971411.1 SnoaL-like domain protein [Hydrocarboniphaga sp.]
MSALQEQLADRAAISDVVLGYATALDQRDWPFLRSLCADVIGVDYSSFQPGFALTLASDEWVKLMAGGFGGFDATQHISSNHVHCIEGDHAICVSYLQASHFLAAGDITACATVFGYYTNRLLRTQQGWKFEHITLTVKARTGDLSVFSRAAARHAADRQDERPAIS